MEAASEAVANTLSRESKDALNATALNAISKLHIVVAAQIEESQAKEDLVEVGWAKRLERMLERS